MTNDEDIETYEEIRRKQARKDRLIVALPILGLALLCIIYIAFWVTGLITPQNANFRNWFRLVGAFVMLIAFLFFVSLIALALLRNRRARTQRKCVRASHF